MQKPTFDPGLTNQYEGPLRRAINQDGSFNVLRRGTSWRDDHIYLKLVSISWPRFFGTVLLAYVIANIVFASVYFALGPGALSGGFEPPTTSNRFATALSFSSQTVTTVGFGSIAPKSKIASLVAAMEAFTGLLGFAVATGFLFGRVSRPSAKIAFSQRALIAPYQEGWSLQFRIVNRRKNALMELEATVLMMTVDRTDGTFRRNYSVLKLERDKVFFFPLTWTVVHPIDSESPLFGKTAEDLKELQAELLILIKAWDETFSQTVHQRYSYRYDEIVWHARYEPAFLINERGDIVLQVDRVGRYKAAPKQAGA